MMQCSTAQTPQRSLRILIVEDERDVQAMLEEVLTGSGHRVAAAPDGKAGLACFQSQPFDIVLTDLNMPGISGFALATEIKKIDRSMPVLLLTGWAGEFEQAELTANGIDCIIKKPFFIADLLQALDDLCSACEKTG
jgi:CheY-like chemotaxis protein